jgi:hypothetical protein
VRLWLVTFVSESEGLTVTTDDARDLVTRLLLAFKRLLLDNRGEVSDADLLELERQIRQEYGGCREYVAGRLPTLRRHRAILEDLQSGMCETDAAARHQVSPRTVRRVRRSGQSEP